MFGKRMVDGWMTTLVISLIASPVLAQGNEETTDRRSPVVRDESGKVIQDPFPQRIELPEGILDGGSEWLNVGGEITLKDLRGKIVLIDFWTYCCINCIHVLPDLKKLEHKYPNELVVIGCHSAKFDNEKDSANIRDAIVRYEIEHPVVNDNQMLIWRKFGTRSWPTIVLIDPEGNFLGRASGEGNGEVLDELIGKLAAYHRAKYPTSVERMYAIEPEIEWYEDP